MTNLACRSWRSCHWANDCAPGSPSVKPWVSLLALTTLATVLTVRSGSKRILSLSREPGPAPGSVATSGNKISALLSWGRSHGDISHKWKQTHRGKFQALVRAKDLEEELPNGKDSECEDCKRGTGLESSVGPVQGTAGE